MCIIYICCPLAPPAITLQGPQTDSFRSTFLKSCPRVYPSVLALTFTLPFTLGCCFMQISPLVSLTHQLQSLQSNEDISENR